MLLQAGARPAVLQRFRSKPVSAGRIGNLVQQDRDVTPRQGTGASFGQQAFRPRRCEGTHVLKVPVREPRQAREPLRQIFGQDLEHASFPPLASLVVADQPAEAPVQFRTPELLSAAAPARVGYELPRLAGERQVAGGPAARGR